MAFHTTSIILLAQLSRNILSGLLWLWGRFFTYIFIYKCIFIFESQPLTIGSLERQQATPVSDGTRMPADPSFFISAWLPCSGRQTWVLRLRTFTQIGSDCRGEKPPNDGDRENELMDAFLYGRLLVGKVGTLFIFKRHGPRIFVYLKEFDHSGMNCHKSFGKMALQRKHYEPFAQRANIQTNSCSPPVSKAEALPADASIDFLSSEKRRLVTYLLTRTDTWRTTSDKAGLNAFVLWFPYCTCSAKSSLVSHGVSVHCCGAPLRRSSVSCLVLSLMF